ncbi:MAG: hypothetical protein Q4F13_06795 [Pseudomonadota bacterium]|nr:hypothetical protein [Pseudomonadota bacterium]
MNSEEINARTQRLQKRLIQALKDEGEIPILCISAMLNLALHMAVHHGHMDVVAALMRGCADTLQEQARAAGSLQ